jgi:hypothetical protein
VPKTRIGSGLDGGMTTTPEIDPLELGPRVLSILQTGRRVATYKLATLDALIGYCVANRPQDRNRGASVAVPLDNLADRVIALYWRQVLPFAVKGKKQTLKQSTGGKARILGAVERLRADAKKLLPATTKAIDREMSLGFVREHLGDEYAAAQREVRNVLVWRPLYRLQRLPLGGSGKSVSDPFLYDDSWMKDKLSPHEIDSRGVVQLKPGVAWGLARLSGLLEPVLQVLWVGEVRRMNPALRDDVPDVQGHLFGIDRVSLERPLAALMEGWGDKCFYCNKRHAIEVDHVLPWSRSHIDGLANLVQACRKCNGDKADSLPAPQHVTKALARGEAVLKQIADTINWTADYDDVRSMARGLYLSTPEHSQTWLSVDQTELLDLSHPLDWMRLPVQI